MKHILPAFNFEHHILYGWKDTTAQGNQKCMEWNEMFNSQLAKWMTEKKVTYLFTLLQNHIV